MTMNLLGIDFGTTKTLAARWDQRRQSPRTIRLGRGGEAIPTTIYADKNGQFQFGEDADDMRASDYAGWKGRIKRDLGRGSSIVLNGLSYPVVDLVARFLEYVLKRAEEEVFHSKVDYTVITVPALYGPSAREELTRAAKQAGFLRFELLEEPVAAGCAFLHEKSGTELGTHVLVFDWGGGTLDLALVEHNDEQFQLRQEWVSGDKNLGGEDIDDSVIEGVDALHAEANGTVDAQPDYRRLHILRNLKEGKELLSRKPEHKFHLPYETPVEFIWRREEFEEFTAATVDRAIAHLHNHLQKILASGLQVHQVLLVGGSSEIPVVRRRIEGELGIRAIRWENSQTAVALGAVVRTKEVNLNEGRTSITRSYRKPPPLPTGSPQPPPPLPTKQEQEPPEASPEARKGSQTGVLPFQPLQSKLEHIYECFKGSINQKGNSLLGVYEGVCTNTSQDAPIEARLVLTLTCIEDDKIYGNIDLSEELFGGSWFIGHVLDDVVTFSTTIGRNTIEFAWSGTIAGNRIVGRFRAADCAWRVDTIGMGRQQGIWECKKRSDNRDFIAPDSSSYKFNLHFEPGSSSSIKLKPSGVGKLCNAIEKSEFDRDAQSGFLNNTAEARWEVEVKSKSDSKNKQAEFTVANPTSGEFIRVELEMDEPKRIIQPGEMEFWHFRPGDVISLRAKQKGGGLDSVYQVSLTDCAPARQKVLPFAYCWRAGTFSGIVLLIMHLDDQPIIGARVLKQNATSGEVAVAEIAMVTPGSPSKVGWAEFSDNSNLQMGDVLRIESVGYLPDIVVIA